MEGGGSTAGGVIGSLKVDTVLQLEIPAGEGIKVLSAGGIVKSIPIF